MAAREGYVAEAEGGTLFIDEVGDMSPLAQVRLLRFLEAGEYQRLGETAARRADVRVISATNVDLERRVREGRFREDLWFRLADEVISLPPLRERGADVLLLARHFLRAQAAGARSRPADAVARGGGGAPRPLLAGQRPGAPATRCGGSACGRPAGRSRSRTSRRRCSSAGRGGRGRLQSALRERETELVQDGARAPRRGILARAAAELGITRQALWLKVRRLGLVVAGP